MSENSHEEAHTGPIKTPAQMLVASIFSFVAPVFIIIGLVYYVASDAKPSASDNSDYRALGGVSQQDADKATAERLRKVGAVEIRDANRPLKAGADVYKQQCAACHDSGAAGAPKLADVGAWSPRIKTGLDALVQSALKGKGAMAAQGGGDMDDVEIARAVVHLANAAGAKFAEPQRAAASASK